MPLSQVKTRRALPEGALEFKRGLISKGKRRRNGGGKAVIREMGRRDLGPVLGFASEQRVT